jgi:hypothetical protein
VNQGVVKIPAGERWILPAMPQGLLYVVDGIVAAGKGQSLSTVCSLE